MAVQINGTTGITTPKLDALDLELGSKNVVERGSNANGEYVRFADGTQICTVFDSGNVTTTASGNLFSGQGNAWTFPASFVSVPSLSMQISALSAWTGPSSSPAVTNTQATLRVFSTAALASAAYYGRYIAIGRWF